LKKSAFYLRLEKTLMKILAIETSCDDTGIAILEYKNRSSRPAVLADLVSSQTKIHAPWGGVVPMLAKREHQHNLVPLLIKALSKAKLLRKHKSQIPKPKLQTINSILEREPELSKNLRLFLPKYQKPKIDYIAATIGPGLEPALWTGVNLARALSFYWNIPLLPVNHLAGHIAAGFTTLEKSDFPIMSLVVSGGHTQLVLVKKINTYRIVGETRDDAAGEAFDKVAKMLNLGYPGGPVISHLASKTKNYKLKTNYLRLPRPMLNSGDLDFSFSGLKTAVLYTLQKMTPAQIKKQTPALAAEFQQAVVDVLTTKILSAAKQFQAKTIMLGGGVAANEALRAALKQKTADSGRRFLVPTQKLCTDNAAMIALAAYYQLKNKTAKPSVWRSLQAQANLRIS